MGEYEPKTNEELVDLYQRTREAAVLAYLCERNKNLVWRIALKIWNKGGQARDIEDVVQECWIDFLKVVSQYFRKELGYKLSTYYWRACLFNRGRNERRDRIVALPNSGYRMPGGGLPPYAVVGSTLVSGVQRPPGKRDRELYWEDIVGSIPSESVQRAEASEEVSDLREAVGKLGERYRYVLLRRSQGITHREIGEGLGVTKERVRQLEEVGLRKLRRLMGPKYESECRGESPLSLDRVG